MDVSTIQPMKEEGLQNGEVVVVAANEMLAATCGVNLEPLEDGSDLGKDGAIIGIITIVGDVDWAIFLGLPSATAPKVAAKFAGFEIPYDSDDMGDAIGELTNILAGDVKRRLDAIGRKVTISLPSVIRAESLQVLVQRNAKIAKTCFNSELGPLWTGIVAEGGGFIA